MPNASGGNPGADDQFELVAFSVQKADREMIEVHQIAREADDFFLE